MEIIKRWHKYPLEGALWGVLIFVIGVILVWPLPALVLRAYENSTSLQSKTTLEAVGTSKKELETQSLWIDPKYLSPNGQSLEDHLNQAENMVVGEDGAVKMSQKCGGWPSQRIACLQAAKAKAKEAEHIVSMVNAQLTSNAQLKLIAREALKTFSVESLSTQVSAARASLNEESAHHLTVHTKEVWTTMAGVDTRMQEIGNHVQFAITAVPPDDSTEKIGDPQLAIDEIAKAKALVDKVNALMSKVTASLGDLRTARTQTQPTIEAATTAISLAEKTLSQINTQYGWGFELALRPAMERLVEGRLWNEQARTTVASLVQPEGKIDWVLAYSQAQNSLQAGQAADAAAKAQVVSYEAAVSNLSSFTEYLRQADQATTSGESAIRTLRQYHAAETWLNAEPKVNWSRKTVDEASGNMETVRSLLAVHNQNFAEAESLSKSTIGDLQKAKNDTDEVVATANALEKLRQDWPNLNQKAAQAIRDEQPGASSAYCEYSTTASANYTSAEKSLTSASQKASAGYYQEATNLANDAITTVAGVKQQCQNAYNSEMTSRTQVAAAATQAKANEISAAATTAARIAEAAEDDDEPVTVNVDVGGGDNQVYDGGWSSNNDNTPSTDTQPYDGGGWNETTTTDYTDGGGWGE